MESMSKIWISHQVWILETEDLWCSEKSWKGMYSEVKPKRIHSNTLVGEGVSMWYTVVYNRAFGLKAHGEVWSDVDAQFDQWMQKWRWSVIAQKWYMARLLWAKVQIV